jgi:hypothetical protein
MNSSPSAGCRVPYFSGVLCARSGEFSIRSTRRLHLSPSAEFLTTGLRDAFPQQLCHPDRSEAEWRDLVFSSGAKTSVRFKQAQGGILHQPLVSVPA